MLCFAGNVRGDFYGNSMAMRLLLKCENEALFIEWMRMSETKLVHVNLDPNL